MMVGEIFESIEGEGPRQGLPALFVRFAGCSLRCAWCDTAYAQNREDGAEMTTDEILDAIGASACEWVVLTGGEPLEQVTPDMVDAILDMGRRVEIETNGACDIAPCLKEGVEVIMDWKLPSSRMERHMLCDNLLLLRPCDTLNLVIANDEDIIHAKRLPSVEARVQVTPCAGLMDLRKLSETVMDMGGRWRMAYQLHKLIWPNEERGV